MRKSDINANSYNATGLERSAWGGWYWSVAGAWPCTKLYSSPKLAQSCMTFGKLNNISIPLCPWTKDDCKDKCLCLLACDVESARRCSPGTQEVCGKRRRHQDRILQNQSCRIGRFGLVQGHQKTCQYKAWGRSRGGVVLKMQKMKHDIDISRP